MFVFTYMCYIFNTKVLCLFLLFEHLCHVPQFLKMHSTLMQFNCQCMEIKNTGNPSHFLTDHRKEGKGQNTHFRWRCPERVREIKEIIEASTYVTNEDSLQKDACDDNNEEEV